MNISNVNHTSEIKAYNHPLFGKVRMFVNSSKPWFCATDIATSLGYANPQKAIRTHCTSKGVTEMDTPTQNQYGTIVMQRMKYISEGNIYRLTAKSELPKAEEFENWIFDDLIPTVINTGNYSLQQQKLPQNFLEALKALVVSEEEKEHLQLENSTLHEQNNTLTETVVIYEEHAKEAAPKIQYHDKHLTSKGLLTINMIAACLGISDIKLNKLLCEWNVQYKQGKTYFYIRNSEIKVIQNIFHFHILIQIPVK